MTSLITTLESTEAATETDGVREYDVTLTTTPKNSTATRIPTRRFPMRVARRRIGRFVPALACARASALAASVVESREVDVFDLPATADERFCFLRKLRNAIR